jgi:hypothetical protein
MRRCLLRWQDERLFPTCCVFEPLGHGFSLNLRLLMVLTHHDPHRRGRLTSHMAPDLQERLRADATRGLATASATPEPVIEPTRDEASHATPGLVAGAARASSPSASGVRPPTAPCARRGVDLCRLVLAPRGVLATTAAATTARPPPPGGPSPAGWSRASCTRASPPSAPAGPARRTAPAWRGTWRR